MVSEIQKQAIADRLKAYFVKCGGSTKAHEQLKVSNPSDLRKLASGKLKYVSDNMWRRIDTRLTLKLDEWQGVSTRDFKFLTALLEDSQAYNNVFAVTGAAGTGKSYCMDTYSRTHEDVYLLRCGEYWLRKHFLVELLKCVGQYSSGLTISEMVQLAIGSLKDKKNPILIFDEADKLTDQVLYFFITLYNELEDKCGMVICSTDYLEHRIRRGLHYNKKGYQEVYSRFGRKFISLDGVGFTDVTQICMANGVTDKKQIQEIFDDCQGDLRRVKRKIHATRRAVNRVISN